MMWSTIYTKKFFLNVGIGLLLFIGAAFGVLQLRSVSSDTTSNKEFRIENSSAASDPIREKYSGKLVAANIPHGDGKAIAPEGPLSEDFRRRLGKLGSEQRRTVFLESSITSRFSKEDLPYIYGALKMNEYATQWGDLVFAVCVLEEDGKALSVVREFVSTPWNRQDSEFESQDARRIIRRVAMSVAKVAILEPSISGPFLEESFEQKGAENLIERWRDNVQPLGDDLFETMVNDVVYGAAYGLLHSRDPGLFKIVEDEYHRIKALSGLDRLRNDNGRLEICIDMLKQRDLYNDMGWDAGISYLYGLSDEALVEWKLSASDTYSREIDASEKIVKKSVSFIHLVRESNRPEFCTLS